jgi:hypothetical protein
VVGDVRMLVIGAYLAMGSPARPARLGPKFPGLGQPEHACGLGLGQNFRPGDYDGRGLGLRNA